MKPIEKTHLGLINKGKKIEGFPNSEVFYDFDVQEHTVDKQSLLNALNHWLQTEQGLKNKIKMELGFKMESSKNVWNLGDKDTLHHIGLKSYFFKTDVRKCRDKILKDLSNGTILTEAISAAAVVNVMDIVKKRFGDL